MTTVRGALYGLLVDGVATVKGEVWEPSAAGPDMKNHAWYFEKVRRLKQKSMRTFLLILKYGRM